MRVPGAPEPNGVGEVLSPPSLSDVVGRRILFSLGVFEAGLLNRLSDISLDSLPPHSSNLNVTRRVEPFCRFSILTWAEIRFFQIFNV